MIAPVSARWNRLHSELPQPHPEWRLALLAWLLGILPAIALACVILFGVAQ